MIVLLTATGGRPIQFNLCQEFMQRQTYKGDVVWIIIDDCMPVTTDNVKHPFKEDWIIIKHYPKPLWKAGMNTQFRNMIEGGDLILRNFNKEDIKAVFIIEDDDYYKPTYLEKMMEKLNGFDIIGETYSIYYNVFYNNYIVWGNVKHCSLFQTAFTPKVIPTLQDICRKPSHNPGYYIDVELWNRVKNKYFFRDGNLAIGIKGLPGRGGIGAGHDDFKEMMPDKDGSYLKSLLGEEDKIYLRYSKSFNPIVHHHNQRRSRTEPYIFGDPRKIQKMMEERKHE
jgi:hypothetical protein